MRFDEALAGYARIRAITDAHDMYDPTDYSNIALTYRDMGDTAAMIATHRESIAAAREHYGEDEPLGPLSAMISLGQAYGGLKRWDEAAGVLREVYDTRRAELPDDSWLVWNLLSLYAWALMGTADWRDAEAHLLADRLL